jgi:hypothetical protein
MLVLQAQRQHQHATYTADLLVELRKCIQNTDDSEMTVASCWADKPVFG